MAEIGLETSDRMLQGTHVWLRDLMDEVGRDDRHRAYGLPKAMLQTVRERVTPVEAAAFAAQLPCWCAGSSTRAGVRSPRPCR